ncbi:MAG: putative acyl protein synthase/acyl-CoA reductase-like protein [Bacteroidetes bacterium]|jgi:phenylacetate-coenzyme A ligase PaaK-like adenylate-forming protein|nr:putative acyl protein synthase/acyl-CoA reductase-like protein [Bacteroidota bacterium]
MTIFYYQATENPVYRRYLEILKIDPGNIEKPEQIPFLPISFFKDHKVICGSNEPKVIFTSSGTSGTLTSSHFVIEPDLYEKSYMKGFRHFYGDPENYCILALLPSYLEREGSSLIYMANDLINKSQHPDSGFYLHDHLKLVEKLAALKKQNQKTILLGVTYALLEITEQFPDLKFDSLNKLIVMETGGMKGKRKEMVREELHEKLCNGFGVNTIHSEYGMTELLSQAYSKGNGVFECPSWMKILIRDTNDPFAILPDKKTGGINVIDLANIYSCSFIATQDLGKKLENGSFEVLGRFDNSDIRGCNLLVQ